MKTAHLAAPLRGRLPRCAASTLPATMLVVAALATFLSLSAALTSQFGRFTGRQQGAGMEAAFCDAALEYIFCQWKVAVGAGNVSTSTLNAPYASTVQATITQANFLAAYPYASQMSIDTGINSATGKPNLQLTIQAVDQNGLNPNSGQPTGIKTQNVPGYPGWTGYTYNYKAMVTVTSSAYGTQGETFSAARYFQMIRMPLCQGLGFYENVMEVHPGATMILTGPIHSNGSIYAQGYGAFLQFKDNVSYVNKFVEGASNPAVTKGWDGSNSGANNPDAYAPYTPVLWADGLPTSYNAYNNMSASTTRQNQVNQVSSISPFGTTNTAANGLHDLIEKPAVYGQSDQIVYNKASLIIEVNSALASSDPNRVAIYVNNTTSGAGPVRVLPTSDDYANVMAAIGNGAVTNMYDQRETATSTLTNLDMAKLNTATTPNSDPKKVTALQTAFQSTDGTGIKTGTVYIHDLAPKTSTAKPAIRLVNGRKLGQNVSVASDNPVYILGDYNTGGSSYGDVPSNQNNDNGTAIPNTSDYSRYASSVMADAVTVLSNNWNDSNANQALNTRKAVPTTVNTAILSGDVASNTNGNGIASGGLHNFPRFLENWQNINFTYYGSLIEAFNSESATGSWQTNQVYYWPLRKWNFDTNFNLVQPPGMPQGLKTSRGRWERFYVNNN